MDASLTGDAALQAVVTRINEGPVTRVLPTRTHGADGVAEGQSRSWVTETERAPSTEMSERVAVGTQRTLRLGQLKPDTEA